MSKWHGGKGSKQRPTDKKKFDDNWDRIFKNKKKSDPSAVDDAADVIGKYTTDGNSAEHFGKYAYAHPAYTRYPHLKDLEEGRWNWYGKTGFDDIKGKNDDD